VPRDDRDRLLQPGTVCVPEWLLEFKGLKLQLVSRMRDHSLSASSVG